MIDGPTKAKRRIFLVGFPRSGTTLVQQILATDTNLFSCQETHFYSNLNPVNKLKKFIPKFFLQFNALGKLKRVLNQDNLILHNIRFGKKDIYKNFISIMDKKSLDIGCDGWCEKTPRHLHFISEIYKFENEIDILFIIRHPVPAINSLHKAINEHSYAWKKTKANTSLEECTRRWN